MFARVKGPVRDTLTRAGLVDRLGPEASIRPSKAASPLS